MKADIYIKESQTSTKLIYFCSIVATSVEELEQTFYSLDVPSTYEEYIQRRTESMMT